MTTTSPVEDVEVDLEYFDTSEHEELWFSTFLHVIEENFTSLLYEVYFFVCFVEGMCIRGSKSLSS